jgi:hypothetical protein
MQRTPTRLLTLLLTALLVRAPVAARQQQPQPTPAPAQTPAPTPQTPPAGDVPEWLKNLPKAPSASQVIPIEPPGAPAAPPVAHRRMADAATTVRNLWNINPPVRMFETLKPLRLRPLDARVGDGARAADGEVFDVL